jgi:hypothetical protein
VNGKRFFLDRINRMSRIFFAFPDERQKVQSPPGRLELLATPEK